MLRENIVFAAGDEFSFLISGSACLIILTLYVEKVEVFFSDPAIFGAQG